MALLVAEVLNFEALREVLVEGRPVADVVEGLFTKGAELADTIQLRSYGSWEEFRQRHEAGESELVQLEGASEILDSDMVVLFRCPMAEEMQKLNNGGQSPAFHQDIVNTYMKQNPGSNAILHPGCIAHQVARQIAVKHLAVKDTTSLNYYQLACRSGATGKIVYDDNGLRAIGMTRNQACDLISGQACLYVLVREGAA